MSAKNTVAGLIIGAATGVALGMLFAPRKGSEMRETLAKTGGDYYDKITEDVKSTVEDQLDKYLKSSSSRAEERAKRQIEEVKREIARIKAN